MFGTNGYGSETTYNTINESIDEMYNWLIKEKPDLTPDERLELAINKCVALDEPEQAQYYATDYKQWAARKAFGGM